MSPLCPILERRHKMPRILFYHGVMDKPYYDRRVQANQIQYKEFERQINYLQRHYHFISIDEFYSRFTDRDKFTGKELVLTFDDGYKNNLTVAAPLLAERKIPFTVFVATHLVDVEGFIPTYMIRSSILSKNISQVDVSIMKKKYLLNCDTERNLAMNEIINFIKTQDDYSVKQVIEDVENQLGETKRMEINSHFKSEQIMSWNDVMELHEMGVIIGSHTEDHAILHKNQTLSIIDFQLMNSKEKIIQHLGECRYFSFPNGDFKSVCPISLKRSSEIYAMSFAANGKSVNRQNPLSFISRIDAAFDINILKAQLSILS